MDVIETPAFLKEHGFRVTPQRLAVAELFFEKPTHETAQTIHKSLKERFPSMSYNTIYLTLSHFEKAGLIRRFYVDGRAVFDSNTTEHDHAYCQICHKLIDIPPHSGRRKAPTALSGWSINQHTQIYSGICPSCTS